MARIIITLDSVESIEQLKERAAGGSGAHEEFQKVINYLKASLAGAAKDVEFQITVRDLKEGEAVAASAASPTVITSTGHGLATGDKIQVSGDTTDGSLDGLQTITVLDPNTFEIDGSTVTVAGEIDYKESDIKISGSGSVQENYNL